MTLLFIMKMRIAILRIPEMIHDYPSGPHAKLFISFLYKAFHFGGFFLLLSLFPFHLLSVSLTSKSLHTMFLLPVFLSFLNLENLI